MEKGVTSRRRFLKSSGLALGALSFSSQDLWAARNRADVAPDYTIRIQAAHVEIAPQHILSTITYNDDRSHGMGIVVEYAGRSRKPQWLAPPPFRWSCARFAKPGASAPAPDNTFDMTFAKDNAADEGFNRWTINGVPFPDQQLHMDFGFMALFDYIDYID